MRLLVIDTATEACSIALFEDGQLIGHFHDVLGRGHAERILPIISNLPDGGRADEIWTDCGPGSFTGIRIGIAAAKGLGLVWKAPVRGLSVFLLIDAGATKIDSAWQSKARAIVMEGGHGEWFVQLLSPDGKSDLQSLSPDAAVALVGDRPVAGSRATQLCALRGGGYGIDLLPDARDAIAVPAESTYADVSAIYGRGADAKTLNERAV